MLERSFSLVLAVLHRPFSMLDRKVLDRSMFDSLWVTGALLRQTAMAETMQQSTDDDFVWN